MPRFRWRQDGRHPGRGAEVPRRTWRPRPPYAEKDYAELKAFARDELGLSDVQAWDTTYVSEKLSIARYSFSTRK